MCAAQPKTIPRLYTHVLEAIAELRENGGSHMARIIEHIQLAFNVSTGKPRPRNVALQVRRAIEHGLAAGMLRQNGGRVRLSLGSKKNNGVRTCCGFVCGKKKKKKGDKGVSKKSHRKGRSKHRKSGGDPCAIKGKSKHRGGKRHKSSGGGKKRKRKHSSKGGGGGSKECAPKRKKKPRRAKKCSEQEYPEEHNENDDNCPCDTCQINENQKNSHVSFADEDEICGEQLQNHPTLEQIVKRRRLNRPPRRTSRQIRQGTPKNMDRINPEFIAEQLDDSISTNEHVPRSCNRNKEDYGVSFNQHTDYINKNFDSNDVHGLTQECDNPDCLCNIKQEPVDTNEENPKIKRDHVPERFSDKKRDSDPGRDKDRDKDRDRNHDRCHDRDRDRNGRTNYFTN